MTFFQILVVILIALATFLIGYFLGKKFEKPSEIGDLHIVTDRTTGIKEIYVVLDKEGSLDTNDKYVTMKVIKSTSQETQAI